MPSSAVDPRQRSDYGNQPAMPPREFDNRPPRDDYDRRRDPRGGSAEFNQSRDYDRNYDRGGSSRGGGDYDRNARDYDRNSRSSDFGSSRDPRSRDPRASRGSSGAPSSSSSSAAASSLSALQSQFAGADPEKAELIMQVLKLTDEQIALLPHDQRQSILQLKKQVDQMNK